MPLRRDGCEQLNVVSSDSDKEEDDNCTEKDKVMRQEIHNALLNETQNIQKSRRVEAL